MANFPGPFVWAEKHISKNSNSGNRKVKDDNFTEIAQNYPISASIRFVKKARMWCKTWFDNPHRGRGGRIVLTQRQEWTKDKPSIE